MNQQILNKLSPEGREEIIRLEAKLSCSEIGRAELDLMEEIPTL